jgi:hypothetical protein
MHVPSHFKRSLPLASCFEDPDTAVTKQSDVFFQKPYRVIAGAFKVSCAAVVQRSLQQSVVIYMQRASLYGDPYFLCRETRDPAVVTEPLYLWKFISFHCYPTEK